ncbi:MAG: hypothetical protein WCI95_06160 [bacterium]
MIANHIHDALGQVDRMRELILERRRFRGYSGTARMLGGCVALATTLVLDRFEALHTPRLQLAGWSLVLAAALILNYGGLALWLFKRRVGEHPLADLRPALEVLPALAVGAALSLTLVLREQYDLLFGVWMCLYGLAHMGYRHSLPRGITVVGLFYQAAGIACLLAPGITFLNPWPMGLVFFVGETVGGWILRSGNSAGSGQSAVGSMAEEES